MLIWIREIEDYLYYSGSASRWTIVAHYKMVLSEFFTQVRVYGFAKNKKKPIRRVGRDRLSWFFEN